jgi:hypothetical protein
VAWDNRWDSLEGQLPPLQSLQRHQLPLGPLPLVFQVVQALRLPIPSLAARVRRRRQLRSLLHQAVPRRLGLEVWLPLLLKGLALVRA